MEKTALHYIVLALQILGLYSPTNSKRVILFSLFYITGALFSILMALIQFPNMKGDIFELVNNLEAVFAFVQILGKVIIVFRKQNELTSLLEKTKKFWKTDVCSDYIKTKLDKISINARTVQTFFAFCAFCCVLGLETYALMENKLILGVWNLKGYEVLYDWTIALQIIMIPFGSLAVCIFDCLFFAICIQTIIQFKIICYCLNTLRLSKENSDIEMKLYVHQHEILLAFLKDFRRYYSPVLFVQCMTIVPAACTEMYALLDLNNMQQFLRHFPAFFCQLTQLSFYCILADSLSKEAMAVGDAVYDSEWYSNDLSIIRIPMTLLIQKSQQEVIFTAGGLFEIKSTTVLTVLKMSWSACTVMRRLKENK